MIDYIVCHALIQLDQYHFIIIVLDLGPQVNKSDCIGGCAVVLKTPIVLSWN